MTIKNKSLSESAAEILAASLSAAGKKPDPSPVDTSVSNIDPAPVVQTKEAPKPDTTGKVEGDEESEDETKEVKEETSEDEELDLTEEEIEEYLSSLSEEEIAALEELAEEEEETDEELEDISEEDEEETEETTSELSEEEVAAARKEELKKLVTDNMGSCKEDIDALFSGESLSEEFKTKATTIFEAAVRARVDAIVEKMSIQQDKILEETITDLETEMTKNIDEYLDNVVTEWMTENKLAIEQGIRTEIAEDFMNGLKNLFVEHYIDIPEDKVNLVDQLADEVADSNKKLEESETKNKELLKALNESKATEILRKTCDGLTEIQVSKIKALAEGVEFTTESEYSQKLAVIRENYFPTGKKVNEAPQALVETETKEVNSSMDRYVNTISKMLPK